MHEGEHRQSTGQKRDEGETESEGRRESEVLEGGVFEGEELEDQGYTEGLRVLQLHDTLFHKGRRSELDSEYQQQQQQQEEGDEEEEEGSGRLKSDELSRKARHFACTAPFLPPQVLFHLDLPCIGPLGRHWVGPEQACFPGPVQLRILLVHPDGSS